MPTELRMVFHMCQRYWPHAHTPIIPWNMAITGFSYLRPFEQPSKLTIQCSGWFIGILTTANIVIPMKQGSKIQKTKSCPEDVFCTFLYEVCDLIFFDSPPFFCEENMCFFCREGSWSHPSPGKIRYRRLKWSTTKKTRILSTKLVV